jgi:hypothetical protein
MRIAGASELPFSERLPFEQSTIIGPRGEYIIGPDLITPSNIDRDAVVRGSKIIFVWGETTYRDAFGKRWRFRFCARNSEIMMRITDAAGITSPGWALSPHPGFGYQETEA